MCGGVFKLSCAGERSEELKSTAAFRFNFNPRNGMAVSLQGHSKKRALRLYYSKSSITLASLTLAVTCTMIVQWNASCNHASGLGGPPNVARAREGAWLAKRCLCGAGALCQCCGWWVHLMCAGRCLLGAGASGVQEDACFFFQIMQARAVLWLRRWKNKQGCETTDWCAIWRNVSIDHTSQISNCLNSAKQLGGRCFIKSRSQLKCSFILMNDDWAFVP